ncbi:MAG TPA: hypothetical protein VIQ31_27240, partial [Phormidium sp.]
EFDQPKTGSAVCNMAEFSNIYQFFDQQDYLTFNPDVAQAVANGLFSSGLEHYSLAGQFENRAATFTGTTGNDVIRGFGNRNIYPTSYELVSASPYDYRIVGTGRGEIDRLIGSDGRDNFLISAYTAPSVPNALQLYLGQGNNDYALIQNFEFAEDSIQLAGSPENYTQQVTNGSLYISQKNTNDLVAIVEGVTSPLSVVDRPAFGGAFNRGTFLLGNVNYFDEQDYLTFNPDVKQAVESGTLESAYEHFIRFGQLEGRAVTFTGTTGNDVIRGFGNNRYFYGTAYQVISTNPYDYRVIGTGTGEIDTLIGAPGVDNFAIAGYAAPSVPNGIQLYLGQGDNDYARIQKFEKGIDTITVAGSINNFTQEVVGGNLNIYSNTSANRDLVAIVEGMRAPLVEVQNPTSSPSPGTIFLG